MIIASIILIGLSLSMDAFAVAITIGICRAEVHLRHALKVALFFGGFQALMPAIGSAPCSRNMRPSSAAVS